MITIKFIRLFLICLSLSFLMVAIPHLKFNQVQVNPMPKPIDTLEKIKDRLENKQNSFALRQSFIPTVSAGADFEKANAYIVIDYDSGQVIASKLAAKRLPMASLTKIMTAIVALDLADPDEEFSVSKKAQSQIPSKVMLKEGEKFVLSKLLEFMLISSANDSAQVIADGIDKKFGEGMFLKAMNQKLQILGLKNTQFKNPAGFDNENHYSSAEDLSVISVYALKEYPEIAKIVAKAFEDLTNHGQDLRFFLNNWNGLLGVYPGVLGVKTGNTEKAGHSTIVASDREGKKILVVLLGAPSVLQRDLWTAELLDLGFSKVAGLKPVSIEESQLRNKYASWKYFE